MTGHIQLNRSRKPDTGHRRGVASILAMMFLVIFGSLAAAMAVVAQGNLRTAYTHMQVSRAMSAAETGMAFAVQRLEKESSRFVIEKGFIDADYAEDLWLGTYGGGDGVVTILPPIGYVVGSPPNGIAAALRDAHLADDHWVTPEPGDTSLPEIDGVFGTLRVRPIALQQDASGNPDSLGPYFRLTYELISGQPFVRVTSEGVSDGIHRTIQMDFELEKRIEYSLISPNRLMIGKNVLVEGPLGTRYGTVAGELALANGDPLVMRSDFYFLDSLLDAKLDTLFQEIATYDVDGDGRLRPEHPVEDIGISGNATLVDYDNDEYVDDFDLFLSHFDANGDGGVVYSNALSGMAVEFSLDDQLSELIDSANPDRDGDGLITASDTSLGYLDGVLDGFDLYAKVRGQISFAIARADWELGHGNSYQTVVHGATRTAIDESPVIFTAPDQDLREVTTAMVSESHTWYDDRTSGSTVFGDTGTGQVAAQIAGGGTYLVPNVWESVPFGSAGAYDFYQRETYRDMTFTNVRIPLGCNALFEDCTFVGVTYLETTEDINDDNWNYTGSMEPVEVPPGSGIYFYQTRFNSLETSTTAVTGILDSRPLSNNIRFHNCTILGSVTGDIPNKYTHWRNKVQFTGNTRFYNDENDIDLLAQADSAVLISKLSTISVSDLIELRKSSILLPGWSVDVGSFQNDPTLRTKLTGIIVAGVMDIRGVAEVNGTLMMTFRPEDGAGPLFYGGKPDAFNTTIGYFGAEDGDGEGSGPGDAGFSGFGQIILRYDPNAMLPDGIPWPIKATPVPGTYVE
ncbi:MAG: hypothetical protein O7G85_11105 [Planctomycetota bacterium]|nr:hypothetical protein [Planctomycetota bacterium]